MLSQKVLYNLSLNEFKYLKLFQTSFFSFQGAKLPAENLITKSLDNIVGNLWNQARQESSGSSAGNQVSPNYLINEISLDFTSEKID